MFAIAKDQCGFRSLVRFSIHHASAYLPLVARTCQRAQVA